MNILALVAAYLIGSFPTALYYAKIFHSIDIRQHGSGNVGATNSLRVLGKKAGIIVLIIDILKGFLIIKTAEHFEFPSFWVQASGLFAVLGHIFSIYSGLKGGKGVATSLGVLLGIWPLGALLTIAVFVILVLIFKYISLGSITGALVFALARAGSEIPTPEKLLAFTLVALVIYAHRNNIRKIINGSENKFPPPH